MLIFIMVYNRLDYTIHGTYGIGYNEFVSMYPTGFNGPNTLDTFHILYIYSQSFDADSKIPSIKAFDTVYFFNLASKNVLRMEQKTITMKNDGKTGKKSTPVVLVLVRLCKRWRFDDRMKPCLHILGLKKELPRFNGFPWKSRR